MIGDSNFISFSTSMHLHIFLETLKNKKKLSNPS